MDDIYYNAKNIGSFGGVDRFISQSKNNKSKKWLNEQLTYQIHKPVKLKYPTRKYSLRDVNVQFQADLVDMTKYAKYNKGIKWMLNLGRSNKVGNLIKVSICNSNAFVTFQMARFAVDLSTPIRSPHMM